MKTTRFLLISILFSVASACSSDSGNSEAGAALDGPRPDAAAPDAMGAPYTPVSGGYKVTAYTAGTDGCMINPGGVGPEFLLNSATLTLTVSVDALGTLKIGNPRGTPAIAALGEGRITSDMVTLTRMNHVTVAPPSTCQYDSDVVSTAILNDLTGKTIGLSVTEKQNNRTNCDVPVGVPMMCTSTWSWRLTPP
jgi:hypothetical protein